jgi:hypothetical protein
MLRIGIDFDNTIACYDHAFCDVAALMGLATTEIALSKVDIKAQILERADGDRDWQRLQGQVYGKHMLLAKVFPGFHEFLYLSKLRGHEVFIVSHKSEYGHFDEDRVPLREQALLWLKENSFFDENGLALSKENVFFEATREAKVRRIRDIGCTHFIDDLREVFAEPFFPSEVKKILFRPSLTGTSESGIATSDSWRALTHELHGSWMESEVCHVARSIFPLLGIKCAEIKKGRGNSRVYKLASDTEKNYALKVYPDRQRDVRTRLETEFTACLELRGHGYPVTEAVAADQNLGWGIYRWISGSHIEKPDEAFLTDATEFLRRLYCDSRPVDSFSQFSAASEACLSGTEIELQVEQRLQRLLAVESNDLNAFLNSDFLPCFNSAVQRARLSCGTLFDEQLPRALQIPSPSDFGAHNALITSVDQIIFMDFEYFGWDDPVKLASDFYWHPGMNLVTNLRQRWISNVLEIFDEDKTFTQRLSAYLPLYGLRWCLILLNEYLQHGAANRLHADPMKAAGLAEIRIKQLNKSRMLLQEIKETTRDHG